MPTARPLPTRRAAALALPAAIALLAVGAPAAHAGTAASCGPVDARPADIGVAAAEDAVSCLVDRERAAAGLAPLADAPALRTAGRAHSADMVRRGFFGHTAPGPLGGLLDRVVGLGYDLAQVGENIASGQETPSDVVAAWVASPKHCENLLSPNMTEDGVGVDLGGTAGTNGPTWTHELGRPAGQSPGPGTAPACDARAPLPADQDVAAWKAPVAAPVAAPAARPAPRTAVVLRASGRRSGRTLRLRVRTAGAVRATLRVTVRQGRRTVRTTRWAAPGTVAVSVRLPVRSAGKAVVVAAGATRTVRFG